MVVDGIVGIKVVVTNGVSIDGAVVAIVDASLETTMFAIVDDVLLATMVLMLGGDSTMIVMEGRVTNYCYAITCSIDLVKSKIEDSILDVGTSSKLDRLDNITYC